MTTRLAVLDPRAEPRPPHRHPSIRDAVEPLDAAGLAHLDLEPYAAVLISGMVDQELLYRHRTAVAGLLDRGGVVVFCGHLHRPWLPGCHPFVPAEIRSFRDYTVCLPDHPHPVFAGVDPDDLTFRRGVAGFFARGHHPPPPGARVLARLRAGQPITYVDDATTPGTVLAHAGADLLSCAWQDSSAANVPSQLLAWVHARSPHQ